MTCASLAGMLWYVHPGLGGRPLAIALAPWAARIAAGRFPFRRTWFDLLFALFLITATSGLWAAYDRDAAWMKFWIILSAIFLCAGGAAGSQGVAGGVSLCGAGLSPYFLLTHDWRAAPTVSVFAGMAFRPSILRAGASPNADHEMDAYA